LTGEPLVLANHLQPLALAGVSKLHIIYMMMMIEQFKDLMN